ncbi:hypothetical protein MTO96_015221 [Rhipicephalus appendiculatus]
MASKSDLKSPQEKKSDQDTGNIVQLQNPPPEGHQSGQPVPPGTVHSHAQPEGDVRRHQVCVHGRHDVTDGTLRPVHQEGPRHPFADGR